MKRSITTWIIILACTATMSLHGCATDKRLAVNDVRDIEPLKVVRYETPRLLKNDFASFMAVNLIFIVPLSFLGIPLATNISNGIAREKGKRITEECQLQDFGLLVMNRFASRVTEEIPDFPEMTVEESPVERFYHYTDGHLLKFEVRYFRLSDGFHDEGLRITTTAELTDPDGDMLWRKTFTYDSEGSHRNYTESLLADNGRLLKEELDLAAEKTVSAFLEHLKVTPEALTSKSLH